MVRVPEGTAMADLHHLAEAAFQIQGFGHGEEDGVVEGLGEGTQEPQLRACGRRKQRIY